MAVCCGQAAREGGSPCPGPGRGEPARENKARGGQVGGGCGRWRWPPGIEHAVVQEKPASSSVVAEGGSRGVFRTQSHR